MFAFGFVVFFGLLFLFIKLPRRWLLRILRYDIAVDVFVTIATLLIHWGSFEGVMAATIAGLLTSLTTSTAKRLFGHVKGSMYYPGVFRLHVD